MGEVSEPAPTLPTLSEGQRVRKADSGPIQGERDPLGAPTPNPGYLFCLRPAPESDEMAEMSPKVLEACWKANLTLKKPQLDSSLNKESQQVMATACGCSRRQQGTAWWQDQSVQWCNYHPLLNCTTL